MRKSLGKVVLAVVIAGLLTGGIAIASAATRVRTVTTPQGTTVDVISVTGTVTEVSTPTTAESGKGFMGMFRHGSEGSAKIKDSADGTVYTLEFGREEAAGITMKVGDTVTVEGTSRTRNSVNMLQIWTFTGADGKTVTLRKADGTPNIETVSVAGTVTEVNVPVTAPSTGDTAKPAPKAMATIKVKQADGTIMTVVLGRDSSSITVKVGDAVKIEGFKTPMDAATIMATSFTGADGKTVTLRGLDGMDGGRGIQGESVTISGTVTEVTQATATTPTPNDATRPVPQAMMTIKVKQADSTVLTVLIGHDSSSITVKVGDAVKIEGFKTSTDATTIMATSFTGADGKTVTLGGKGFGGCGMRGGPGDGRGFGGGMKRPGSVSDSTDPSNT
ncbi:MAG TPA: hypothetical protein VN478_01740 [Clostridia bacterium]|nr:hypothetical protein [Clostridia bacterium]